MRYTTIVLVLGVAGVFSCKPEAPAWPPSDHRVVKFVDAKADLTALRGRQAKARLDVRANHYEVDPSLIRVRPRQPVNLTIRNETDREHHVALSLINGGLSADDWIDARDTATLTFTAPAKPGTYPLRCPASEPTPCTLNARLVVVPNPET